MSDFDAAIDALEEEVGSPGPEPEDHHDDDLIPDPGGSTYTPTEADLEVDRIVDTIDIIDAYNRWCGKSTPEPGGRTEGIKVSCPRPDHPDRNPSAWINTDKQTYFCGGCQEGGDKYTIAAHRFGYGADYQHGKNFPDLKRDMVRDLGYVVEKSAMSGRVLIAPPQDESDSSSDPPTTGPPLSTSPSDDLAPADDDDDLASLAADFGASSNAGSGDSSDAPAPDTGQSEPPSGQGGQVVRLADRWDPDADELIVEYPSVPWRTLLPEDTFMRRWMEVCSHDDLPEEFYFWLGMMAVGFAGGRDVVLADNPEVRTNLYVCLYGHSGMGKSRAVGALTALLREALPYDHEDPGSTGTYLVPSPGSSEALVDAFSKPIEDGTGRHLGWAEVRGLVRFDELSTLIGRASRAGNPMKPALMEFFDGYHPIEHKTRGMGHVHAENYYTSVLTSTQPRSIRTLLSQGDADSGFANRWIFAAGKEKMPEAYGRQSLDIASCVIPLRDIRGWAALPKAGNAAAVRSLVLEGTALDLWSQFFYDVLLPVKRDDDSTLMTRSDLMMKKLITLFAMDRKEPVPTARCVQDAIGLWDYLKASYALVSPEVGLGEFEHIRSAVKESILRYMARNGDRGPTTRELIKLLQRRKFPSDLLSKVIKTMTELGELDESVERGERGPAKTRYTYVA